MKDSSRAEPPWRRFRVGAGFLLLLVLAGCSRPPEPGEVSGNGQCNVHEDACTSELSPGIALSMDIQPKPVQAMSDLEFIVALSGREGPLDGGHVELELTMPGMFMGENRHMLQGSDNGEYRGHAIIPRCPSGKKLWRADIHVRLDDLDKSAYFLFDVK